MIALIYPYAPAIVLIAISVFMGYATNDYPLDKEKLERLNKERGVSNIPDC